VTDPNEFVRSKHAESAWMKLSQAFNQGKCTLDQLNAEIHEMRQSVIVCGIPLASRPIAYLLLAGLTESQVAAQQTTFNGLVESFFQLPVTNSLRRDIRQDLGRTFPDHNWFCQDPKAQESLHRILGAFAMSHPTIGYCQSINFLAGFLLIIFDHKELPAYAVLSFMIDNILEGYHSRSLVRIMADMNVLDALIEERIPQVHQQFKKYNVSISLFAPNWFMSGFTNYLPSMCVAHLWDWMLLDKDLSVMFRVALGIISLKEEGIITAKGTNELVIAVTDSQLSELTAKVELPNLISYIHQTIRRVPLKTLQELREEAYVQQYKEFQEYQTKKEMVLLSRTTHFDQDQLSKLKERFMKIANEDGVITLDQLEGLLKRLTITKNNPELIELYMRIFNKHGNRMIEFCDIAAGLSVIFKGTPSERLKLIFQVFDADNSNFLERNEVTALINTIYSFYYDSHNHPDTEVIVNILFDNLDTKRIGKLSFEDFQGALLLEPKLARCFIPPDDNSKGVPEKDRSVFGLMPILNDSNEAPANGKSETVYTDAEKQKIVSKFNSRSELLDSIAKENSKAVDATSSAMVSDDSCCVIS